MYRNTHKTKNGPVEMKEKRNVSVSFKIIKTFDFIFLLKVLNLQYVWKETKTGQSKQPAEG